MTKAFTTFEAEGDSLSEARENLVPQLPDGYEIIEEEVIDKPEKTKKKYSAENIDAASILGQNKIGEGMSIFEEKVLQEPQETSLTIEAFTEEEAIRKAKRRARGFCKIHEVVIKSTGKKRFFGLSSTPSLYRVKLFKQAVIEVTYQSPARICVYVVKKRKKRDQLYCTECGSTQFDGDWEKLMDETSKAAGLGRFFNISAPPQCLNCGRESLLNLSEQKKHRQSMHKRRKELRKIRSTPEFAELIKLSKQIDFPASTAREKSLMKKVRRIGEELAQKGGVQLMSSFIRALPTSPGHERLWRDFVSSSWDGIKDESDNRWMH